MKKVVIIGPECSGKSTLAETLAEHYKTNWVPEFARFYIDNLSESYTRNDLLKIAYGQINWEDEYSSKTDQLLICDTDLRVIKIWSEHKYGSCDEEILNYIAERQYDLYLLTDIDIPWQHDPQREHPDQRLYFRDVYRKELSSQDTKVIEISGSPDQRKGKAIKAIDSLFAITANR